MSAMLLSLLLLLMLFFHIEFLEAEQRQI